MAAAAAAAPPLVDPGLLDSPSAVQGPVQQAASPHTPDSSTAPARDVSTFPAGATFDNKLFQPSLTAQAASVDAASALQGLQQQDMTQASTVQLLEQLQVRVQQALAAAGSISTLPSQVPELRAPAAVPADEWEGVTLMSSDQLQQAGVAMQGASAALLPEPRAPASEDWAGAQLVSDPQLQDAPAPDDWAGAQLMCDTQLQEAGIHMSEDTAGLRARQAIPAGLAADSAEPVPRQPLPRRASAQRALQDQPQQAPFFARQASAKRGDDPAQAQSPSQMMQQAQTLALQAQQLHLSSQAAVHRLRKANHARTDASVPAPQLPQAPVPLASPGFRPVSRVHMGSKLQQQQSRQVTPDAPEEPPTSSVKDSAVQRPSLPLWRAKPGPMPVATAEAQATAQNMTGADVQTKASLQAFSAEPAPEPVPVPSSLASKLSDCAPLQFPQQQQQQQQATAAGGAVDPDSCLPAAAVQASSPPEPSTRHVWSEAEARLASAPPTSSLPGPTSTDHGVEEPASTSGPLPAAQVLDVLAPASQGSGERPESSLAGNAPPLQVRQGGPATLPLLVSSPGYALQ